LKQLAAAKFGADWVGVARLVADRQRIIDYANSQGAHQEQHGGTTLYAFGSQRPFRIAFITDDLVAFSASEKADRVKNILDRHTGGTSGSAGDALRSGGLLTADVLGKALWFVADANRLHSANPEGPSAGPFRFGEEWFEGSKTITGWILSSPLNLQAELVSEFDSAANAERSSNAFNGVLSILQAIPKSPADGQTDYSPFLTGVKISHQGSSVTVLWKLEPSMLISLVP
jgi:hypothetical protein